MNSIYTITVMSRLEETELGWPNFGSSRTVGWVSTKEDAEEAVLNNDGDINESCYDYAVIEEVEEGLYPNAMVRWFYKYDYDKHCYFPIDEPAFMAHFCNLGIG